MSVSSNGPIVVEPDRSCNAWRFLSPQRRNSLFLPLYSLFSSRRGLRC
jgi:hypothetical protein